MARTKTALPSRDEFQRARFSQPSSGGVDGRWHQVGRVRLPSWLLWVFMVAVALCSAPAQTNFYTLLTNGPTAKRFNIVFLSEGYTTNQLAAFREDATNALAALLSYQPYQEYRSNFNAFAISVPSAESGSDHPNSATNKNTFFNSFYDIVSDYLITIPADSTGQGRVDALLQTYLPGYDLAVLVVNDTVPGGSDGFDKTAIVAKGTGWQTTAPILVHETGHVVANLGDEYEWEYPGFPDTEEPNTTRETNRANIKWNAWISTNTPIPTVPQAAYPYAVGLFEGAHYHSTNWYRPRYDCMMRSQGGEFCEVCREAMVLSFYRRVRPVESFTPGASNLTASTASNLTFSLSLLQPTTHSLTVQWLTNGVAVPGATNATVTLSPRALPNGSNLVAAVVVDPTGMVRNDPTNLLRQTVTWNLDVNLLRLDSQRALAGGKFAFRVTGSNNLAGVSIFWSSNLSNWMPASTNFVATNQFWFTNSGADALPRKFFRAVR